MKFPPPLRDPRAIKPCSHQNAMLPIPTATNPHRYQSPPLPIPAATKHRRPRITPQLSCQVHSRGYQLPTLCLPTRDYSNSRLAPTTSRLALAIPPLSIPPLSIPPQPIPPLPISQLAATCRAFNCVHTLIGIFLAPRASCYQSRHYQSCRNQSRRYKSRNLQLPPYATNPAPTNLATRSYLPC
jgi:hypothetical protein